MTDLPVLPSEQVSRDLTAISRSALMLGSKGQNRHLLTALQYKRLSSDLDSTL